MCSFDPEMPIVVTTDASKIVIGTVLQQSFQEGIHSVVYILKTLNPTEQTTHHTNPKLSVSYIR